MKTYKLGEVCELSKGKTITRATTRDGQVPVIGGGLGPTYFHDVDNRKPPVITISASGANAGFVNYWDMPIWASDCTTIIEKPGSPALIGYIYKYLQSRQNFINSELRRGSAQPHVYPSDIANLEIQLPSLEKQYEIVNKLDNTFAEIKFLQENNLKAMSLNSLLLNAKIDTEFGAVSVDEPLKTLGELGKISYGYTAKSSLSFKGPKYLRITDIQDKMVNWQEVPHCEISEEEKSKFLLNVGDIVFARTGATTGKSFLIKEEVDAVFASYLIRIKPEITFLNPEFLYYFFQSSFYWDEIAGGISGSAQGGFNASKLQAMSVRFPTDMKSQREIVQRIRDFEIELNKRSNQLSRQALQISNLQQSLLSRAFTQERTVA
jgi:type I restriction enzyme S subunit